MSEQSGDAVWDVAGAWFLSPWVVRWYVRRMEPEAPAIAAEAQGLTSF